MDAQLLWMKHLSCFEICIERFKELRAFVEVANKKYDNVVQKMEVRRSCYGSINMAKLTTKNKLNHLEICKRRYDSYFLENANNGNGIWNGNKEKAIALSQN